MDIDIDQRIRKIEEEICFLELDFQKDGENFYHFTAPIRIKFFELDNYSGLFKYLYTDLKKCTTYSEKKTFIPEYKKVFHSIRKVYNQLLSNIELDKTNIILPESLNEYIYQALDPMGKLDKKKTLRSNIKDYLIQRIKENIKDADRQMKVLDNYPGVYLNTLTTNIGPEPFLYNTRKNITYKDAVISIGTSAKYTLHYNEDTAQDTKNAILNQLAYLSGGPSFYFTENYTFNSKLDNLYSQFDLLDMLRLRKKDFFERERDEPFSLEHPVLNANSDVGLVVLEDSPHEMLFELYHASLKQFESLPRCVFLFRVFEYGAANHYKKVLKPAKYTNEDSLEYYLNEAFKHRYIPLRYLDTGNYREGDKYVNKRKPKYVNFTSKLKEEAKVIMKEWGNDSYLGNKKIGNIIYSTGRNASAHGGSGRGNARYDYAKNYKHINNVNIFLELIARYIVETLNPSLGKVVERRKKYYIRRYS